MDTIRTKPKLAYFQYKYDEHLADFLLIHKQEHVKCLSEWFDVTVIDEDCDYQQICETYQPDLTLVESGVPFSSCHRPHISNRQACSHIPKLGFLHSDAFCEGRAGFLSDMDHWGIETFFSIATTAAEHTPEIADSLFIWPNFIDADVYRDYGQWKNIPLLFTGNTKALYPWRRQLFRLLSKHYPSLTSPHPGYSPSRAVTRVMVGELYARMLNASWFVPTCGTVAHEVIRKHFEVPACKACLITEQTPAIEAAGFVDMTNCVFADEHNILDKIEYLFQNPDALNGIINAGHQLIHSRHTLKHRDQVFQWYSLHRNLKSNQQIIQPGPFEPLRVEDRSLGLANTHIVSNGLQLALLRRGDEKLWNGDYDEAETMYLKCVNYYLLMPEPHLRLALCNLYKGNAKTALSWIVKPIQFTLADYNAVDPDPVEWAYFIISLLCLGNVGQAVKRAGEFAWLRHPELDRTRTVVNVWKKQGGESLLREDASGCRLSIHSLPDRSFEEWSRQLFTMLRSCGQYELADTLTKRFTPEGVFLEETQDSVRARREISAQKKDGLRKEFRGSERKVVLGAFQRQRLYGRVRSTLKRAAKYVLHRLEAKCGYFLPYRLSGSRNDEFFHTIQDVTQEEDIKTALVIGAALREGSTEALLAGALENQNKPSVFCIGASRRRFIGGGRISPKPAVVKWYELSSSPTAPHDKELERTIIKIKKENQITCFDVLLIDGSELGDRVAGGCTVANELYGARFVFLDDINSSDNRDNYDRLLKSPMHFVLDQNPGLRNGYAIFEKDAPTKGESGP